MAKARYILQMPISIILSVIMWVIGLSYLSNGQEGQTGQIDLKPLQKERAAVLFLVAGQSNAGGTGVLLSSNSATVHPGSG